MDRPLKLVIVTTPLTEISEGFAKNFIKIIAQTGSSIRLISGIRDKKYFCKYVEKYTDISYYARSKWQRLSGYIASQLITSKKCLSEDASLYIFFLSQTQLIPIFLIKIFKRKTPTVLFPGGSVHLSYKQRNVGLSIFFNIMERIGYCISDNIILYSKSQMCNWRLDRYSKKIAFAREHFIDANEFKIINSLSERGNTIGFVGRLSSEKGILSFVEAAKALVSERNDIHIIIAGSGEIESQIRNQIKPEYLGKFEFCGWVPRSEIPKLLNRIRILVIPSYTEGLPNVMLEAMACGTLVIATSVGTIPDIIKDGETGFILKDNSPKTIKEGISRAIEHKNQCAIVEKSLSIINNNFSFDESVRLWVETLALLKRG